MVAAMTEMAIVNEEGRQEIVNEIEAT